MTQPFILHIVCGGRSEEHAISLLSTRAVVAAVKDTAWQLRTTVISRSGGWLSEAESIAALERGDAASGGLPAAEGVALLAGADVVFPLIHGPTGEDGTLQGLLEMLEIPYVGSGVLASAACMDKVVSKQILADNNIPQVRFCGLTPDDIDTPSRCEASAERVAKTLKGPPWFVKPANMGSSVGIAKVRTQADLPAAFRQARGYDRRVIVEEGLVGVRELELGILGNDAPQASSIGEITYDAEFYDYATKYTDGRAQLHLPAALEGHVVDKIQHLARKAYRALNCAGMARVDFFYLPQSQEIYLNELNTCPGFTQYSMFPSVWRHSGLPLRQLVERLVTLAQEEAAATGPLRRATLAHLHA